MLMFAAIAGGALLVLWLLGMMARLALAGPDRDARTRTQTRYGRQMA